MKEKNILVKGHIIGPEEWNGRGYKRSAFRGYKRSSFRGYNRCTAHTISPTPVVSALGPSLPKGSEHLLSHRDLKNRYRKFMEHREDMGRFNMGSLW